jgi:hypothetical protein
MSHLKQLCLSSLRKLENSAVKEFLEWLVGELAYGPPKDLRMSDERQPPSSITSITLDLLQSSLTAGGMEPEVAGRLADALSDTSHYPMLEDVTIQIRSLSEQKPCPNYKKEVLLAMHALDARGVLRLHCE